MPLRHPSTVLFAGERPFPFLPAVDHYAGAEKLIRKAMALQAELGPIFDITCDCEDGARAGAEREHAEMCAALIMSDENVHGRVAARIHDITHEHWRDDLDILVRGAGTRLPFITLPKPCSAADVATQIPARGPGGLGERLHDGGTPEGRRHVRGLSGRHEAEEGRTGQERRCDLGHGIIPACSGGSRGEPTRCLDRSDLSTSLVN